MDDGRVRRAIPFRFVDRDDDRFAFFLGPGTQGKWMGRAGDNYLRRWVRGEAPVDLTWSRTNFLQLARPGDSYTVEVVWDESWTLLGWYVNLQAPLRFTRLGYDTTDWALDVVVDPDGEWSWKDEDDLAVAIELGMFDERQAAAVREIGERVIERRPWPTGWEDWRPSPDWKPLPLPSEWDVVDSGTSEAPTAPGPR